MTKCNSTTQAYGHLCGLPHHPVAGSLPFTGLDTGALFAGGLILLLLGLAFAFALTRVKA